MKSSIKINHGPRACTDGSIIPGCIIVQNYLTEHYLDRAISILAKHTIEPPHMPGIRFDRHATDPDGDPDSIQITIPASSVTFLASALQDLQEVSDGVEAVDLIREKETGDKLKAEQDKFEESIKALRRIMEG